MLHTLDGKPIRSVAHAQAFNAALQQLGEGRAAEVRAGIHQIVDELEPNAEGKRSFGSSALGSKLTPWPFPLSHIYDVASEMLGPTTEEEIIREKAALIFGQFVWECIMNRPEYWVFYDPNLSAHDPNREIIGKVYFERGG
jgi:hypothetical protein